MKKNTGKAFSKRMKIEKRGEKLVFGNEPLKGLKNMNNTINIPKDLFEEILEALKDEKNHYKSQWDNVGNHPASRHKREFVYFSGLIKRVESYEQK